MSDASKPARKDGADGDVRRIKAPIKLDYTVTAGLALSRFLKGVTAGKLLGQRCGVCNKVYVPPRGGCPTCGVGMGEQVEVKDTGTLTTFCIVNVPFEGQTMKLPYVYGCIALDGADNALHQLILAPPEEVRMGMRLRAEWVPPESRPASMEAIRWFVPTGEPDAPWDSYKEHL